MRSAKKDLSLSNAKQQIYDNFHEEDDFEAGDDGAHIL